MDVSLDLLRRYDRPGPRYTSYPTAVEFHDGVDAAVYGEHLARAAERTDEPLSLYLHLPFCEERCLYCGCSVVITRKPEIGQSYLDVLLREIDLVADRLGGRRRLRQLHLGGGTPTWYAPDQLRVLLGRILDRFEIEEGAEQAVEVDPRVTSTEHLAALHEAGFTRVSCGVQDFTLEVQETVNRVQSFEETRDLIAAARAMGYDSVNVDLIYGLPLQRPDTFHATLERVLEIRPERLAVYSYAHVPWLKGQQRRIVEDTLPPPETKLRLFLDALETFRGGGYLSVGMDHFALPEDEMGQAIQNGTLWRNFMGYTVRHAPDMVALGMTGIGDVAGLYVQNAKKLVDYERAIGRGELAAERGIVLTDDDRLRRHVITTLMCTMRLDFEALRRSHGIEPREVFATELGELGPFVEDGLVVAREDGIELTELGRLFVRNVAMLFDARLRASRDVTKPRFSRTV